MKYLKKFNENVEGLTKGDIRKIADRLLDKLGTFIHFYSVLPESQEEYKIKIDNCLKEITDSGIDFEKDVVKSVRDRKDHIFSLLVKHNLI
jgi:hypothetical protein